MKKPFLTFTYKLKFNGQKRTWQPNFQIDFTTFSYNSYTLWICIGIIYFHSYFLIQLWFECTQWVIKSKCTLKIGQIKAIVLHWTLFINIYKPHRINVFTNYINPYELESSLHKIYKSKTGTNLHPGFPHLGWKHITRQQYKVHFCGPLALYNSMPILVYISTLTDNCDQSNELFDKLGYLEFRPIFQICRR